jgi:hypothetical protein
MSSARDVYAKARQSALTKRGDPQHTGSPADPRLAAAALNAPCGSCGHGNRLHQPAQRNGRQVAAWCTIITAAGVCGCRLFTPAEEVPSI